MKQIAKQAVEPPNDEDVAGAQRCVRQEKGDSARRDLEYVTKSVPLKTQRAAEFIKEKGASSWLSVMPLKEMNSTLNKREFRDAIKLRYGWKFNDIPTVCVCGDLFDTDHVCVEDILYSGTTKFEISRLKYSKRCVLTLRWSWFSKKLRVKCCRGAPTRPLTRDRILVRGASGRENSLLSLTLGYVTLTQTHTRISPRSRSTSYTRMTKSAFTRLEFLR